MSQKLIKEYIQTVLLEKGFFLDAQSTDKSKDKKKKKGWWNTLMSRLSSTAAADELAEEWIEDQELYYDADFSDEIKEKIQEYTRVKLPRIVSRAKGDTEKAKRLTKKALETKFNPELQKLRQAARERERQEDADID